MSFTGLLLGQQCLSAHASNVGEKQEVALQTKKNWQPALFGKLTEMRVGGRWRDSNPQREAGRRAPKPFALPLSYIGQMG
jgi:hypothetical protein